MNARVAFTGGLGVRAIVVSIHLSPRNQRYECAGGIHRGLSGSGHHGFYTPFARNQRYECAGGIHRGLASCIHLRLFLSELGFCMELEEKSETALKMGHWPHR